MDDPLDEKPKQTREQRREETNRTFEAMRDQEYRDRLEKTKRLRKMRLIEGGKEKH